MAEVGELQFAGYHGTTIANARGIEQNGFQGDSGPICFAPLDNLGFAQGHGRRRAEERGDGQYGVVMASFPSRKLESRLGGDQINVPAADVGRIVVRNALVFETRPSGLMAPRPLDQ
jgi:hypothetical protein